MIPLSPGLGLGCWFLFPCCAFFFFCFVFLFDGEGGGGEGGIGWGGEGDWGGVLFEIFCFHFLEETVLCLKCFVVLLVVVSNGGCSFF